MHHFVDAIYATIQIPTRFRILTDFPGFKARVFCCFTFGSVISKATGIFISLRYCVLSEEVLAEEVPRVSWFLIHFVPVLSLFVHFYLQYQWRRLLLAYLQSLTYQTLKKFTRGTCNNIPGGFKRRSNRRVIKISGRCTPVTRVTTSLSAA